MGKWSRRIKRRPSQFRIVTGYTFARCLRSMLRPAPLKKHKSVQQKLGLTESNFCAAENDLSARFALLQMLGVGRVAGVRGLATMFQGKLLAAEILAEVPWQAFIMITHKS